MAHASPTSTEPAPGAGPAGAPTPPSRRGWILVGLAAVLLLATVAFVIVALRYHDQHSSIVDIRATGIPASIPTSTANLMALSSVPSRPAPPFTLTDQNGRTLSLASLRGHPVVLEFMDSHCVDICPIVSQEFVDAYHDLGSSGARTVFAAVNVNQYHRSVADVAAFSREHQLDAIPGWHFFTGSLASLRAVWGAYGVEVVAPSPNVDILHSSFVLFIDAAGHERFIASPMVDHTAAGRAYLPAVPLAAWGQGIALVAQDLTGRPGR